MGKVYWKDRVEGFSVEVGGESSNNSKRQLRNIVGSRKIGLEEFEVVSVSHWEEEWEGKTWKLIYRGEEPLRIRTLIWHLELPIDGREWEVLAPGYRPGMLEGYDLHRKIADFRKNDLLTLEENLAPAELPGIVGIYNPKKEQAFLAWNKNDNFYSEITLFAKKENRILRDETFYCPCILQPGDELDFGTFYIGEIKGTRTEAVRKVSRSLWEAEAGEEEIEESKVEGLKAGKGEVGKSEVGGLEVERPEVRKEEADKTGGRKREELRIREVTLGAKQLRTPYPEYDDLFRKLPEIKAQGYNALMLAPYFPWPGWAVHDLMDGDITYHSLEGLKELSSRLHEMGMKLILEIPQRGVGEYDTERVDLPQSPILDRLELYGYHETGHIRRTYLRAFDFASKAYEKYLTEALLYYCREAKADGFLLDAQMWNAHANWQPGEGKRPYESITGGIRMMERVKKALRQEFPEVFFIGQSGGPEAAGYHDYTIAYPLHWARWGLAPMVDKRETLKCFHNYICENTLSWRDYMEWYQEYAAAMPEGTAFITGPDTGKSTEWMLALGSQFDREIFGKGAHLAMLGAAMFMGHGVQVYEGADTELEEAYGKLLKKRSGYRWDEWEHGKMAYVLGEEGKKTAAVVWIKDGKYLLYCGNLEGKEKTVRVAIPDCESTLTILLQPWQYVIKEG